MADMNRGGLPWQETELPENLLAGIEASPR